MNIVGSGGMSAFIAGLEAGKKVRLLVSPVAEKVIPDIERFYGYLAARGVLSVHRVLPYADMAVWLYYKELLAGNPISLVSSACAGVSIYLQSKQFHSKRELLSSAPSPLRCAAWYLRSQYGYTEPFVFLSPCLLKSKETQDMHGEASIQEFLSISEILEWVELSAPELSAYQPILPEENPEFPGLTVQAYGSVSEPLKELMPDLTVVSVQGLTAFKTLIENNSAQVENPRMYEVYACEGGCYHGSGVGIRHKLQRPLRFMADAHRFSKSPVDALPTKKNLGALFSHFDSRWGRQFEQLM